MFLRLLKEKDDKNTTIASGGDDYELIADGYLAMLRDTLDTLDDILLYFDATRLDRRKVYSALRQCRDTLYNNL